MKRYSKVFLVGAALLALVGCGGGNGSTAGPNPSPDPNSAAVDQIFGSDVNGDPTPIQDAGLLMQGLNDDFGEAADSPIIINPADSISDVLNRARNG